MWDEMSVAHPWLFRLVVSAVGTLPFVVVVWLGRAFGLGGTVQCSLAAIGLCISTLITLTGGGYPAFPLATAFVMVPLSAHSIMYAPTGLQAMREDLIAYGFWERERKGWYRTYVTTMTRNVLRFSRGLPMLIWVPEQYAVRDAASPTGFSWHPGERLYAPGDVRNIWRVMIERPQEDER